MGMAKGRAAVGRGGGGEEGSVIIVYFCYKHIYMSKGTFLEQQQMYRVLFKVQSVHLRLREEVEVQVVIKKGQENFVIPHKARLLNSVAALNAHAEFFVSEKNPTFDVFVMILHGATKKFAGMCEVNLNQWQQNSNNQTTSILLKSPDANATIIFNFMYLTSDVPLHSKNLVSLGELELKRRGQMMKQIEDKYSQISKQNNKLHEEVLSLRSKNHELIQNKEQMEVEYSKNCEQFQQRMKNRDKQVENSEQSLNRMRKKIEKIEEIVNQYGEARLREKMEGLLQDEAMKD